MGAALALHAAACVADCQDLPGTASPNEQMGRADFAAQVLIYRAAESEVIFHVSLPPQCQHKCDRCDGWLNAFLYAFVLRKWPNCFAFQSMPSPTSMQVPLFSALQSPVVVQKALDLVSATAAALESAAEVCLKCWETLIGLQLCAKQYVLSCFCSPQRSAAISSEAAAAGAQLLPSHLTLQLLLLQGAVLPSSEEYQRLQGTLLQTMTQNPVPALRNAAWHTWNDVLDLTQVRGLSICTAPCTCCTGRTFLAAKNFWQ